jgi:DNA invertase Pin-like site-specific DNA recombinase
VNPDSLIPAAQYLRMSTDHQKFSLESQAAAIQRYAAANGFRVVQTYEHPGKSGLMLKHREGLTRLLQDVFSGSELYKAILVYDVSRWGRFQDTDEAAHYEFVCRNAGTQVHYCCETFENNGTPPNAIMKTLKRIMAGEYSRELSVRLRRTKTIMATEGWWLGGPPPYGLRRMLVSFEGCPKQLLKVGEVKSIAGGRVTLVPGSPREVSRVREIYRLTISDRRSANSIAREFNRKGSKCCGRRWTYGQILAILRNPKYMGCSTWGRTRGVLGVGRMPVPKEEWTLKPGAFRGIIDEATFEAAQRVLTDRTFRKSDDDLLDSLRMLLARQGKLSQDLINAARDVPGHSTYLHRFGSIRSAYEMIGYPVFRNHEGIWQARRRHHKIKQELLRRILRIFPREVNIIRERPAGRQLLRFRDGLKVSVLVCQCMKTALGEMRWCVPVIPAERGYVALACRCTPDNTAFKDFYLLRGVDKPQAHFFRLKEDDPWWKRGKRLTDLSKLRRVADSLLQPRSVPLEGANETKLRILSSCS